MGTAALIVCALCVYFSWFKYILGVTEAALKIESIWVIDSVDSV